VRMTIFIPDNWTVSIGSGGLTFTASSPSPSPSPRSPGHPAMQIAASPLAARVR